MPGRVRVFVFGEDPISQAGVATQLSAEDWQSARGDYARFALRAA